MNTAKLIMDKYSPRLLSEEDFTTAILVAKAPVYRESEIRKEVAIEDAPGTIPLDAVYNYLEELDVTHVLITFDNCYVWHVFYGDIRDLVKQGEE